MLRPAAIATLLTLLLLTWIGIRRPVLPQDFDCDAAHYISLANAEEGVLKPFANRVLNPLMARATRHVTNWSVSSSFLFVSVVAFWLWIVASLSVSLRLTGSIWPVLCGMGLPFMFETAWERFLPDLPHAALLSAFIWAMLQRQRVVAILLLLLLQLTREATILLVGVMVLIEAGVLLRSGLNGRRLAWAAAVVLAAGTGMVLVSKIVEHSQNRHSVGNLAYLVLKLPFNTLHNFFGLDLWTNTFVRPAPEHTYELPAVMRFGQIHTIGLGGFDPAMPLQTVSAYVTAFGVAPGALWALFRQRRALPKSVDSTATYVLQLATLYGLISYLIGPTLGASVSRLIAFGWPAFALAVPVMLARLPLPSDARRRLVFVHLGVAWIPPIMLAASGRAGLPGLFPVLLAILIGLAGNAWTVPTVIRILRGLPPAQPGSEPSTDVADAAADKRSAVV